MRSFYLFMFITAIFCQSLYAASNAWGNDESAAAVSATRLVCNGSICHFEPNNQTYGMAQKDDVVYVGRNNNLSVVKTYSSGNALLLKELSFTGAVKGVVINGNTLFACDENGVNAYNISNAANPTLINKVSLYGPVEDILMLNGLIYAAVGNGLSVLEMVSGKLKKVGQTYTYGDSSTVRQYNGNLILVDAQGIHVISIANPRTPKVIRTMYFSDVMAMTISGENLYVYGYTGFAVYSLTSFAKLKTDSKFCNSADLVTGDGMVFLNCDNTVFLVREENERITYNKIAMSFNSIVNPMVRLKIDSTIEYYYSDCSGHGTFNGSECVCEDGYMHGIMQYWGMPSQEDVLTCVTNPCNNENCSSYGRCTLQNIMFGQVTVAQIPDCSCVAGHHPAGKPNSFRLSCPLNVPIDKNLSFEYNIDNINAIEAKANQINPKVKDQEIRTNPIPWPGHYWERYYDSINLRWDSFNQNESERISPAKKYALLFDPIFKLNIENNISIDAGIGKNVTPEALCSKEADEDDCERRFGYGYACGGPDYLGNTYCLSTELRNAGLCDQLVPAQINETEPENKVVCTLSPTDRITFEIDDIKALLSYIYPSAAAHPMGFGSDNAAEIFLTTVNYIGVLNKPFGLDSGTTGAMNHALFAYKNSYTVSPEVKIINNESVKVYTLEMRVFATEFPAPDPDNEGYILKAYRKKALSPLIAIETDLSNNGSTNIAYLVKNVKMLSNVKLVVDKYGYIIAGSTLPSTIKYYGTEKNFNSRSLSGITWDNVMKIYNLSKSTGAIDTIDTVNAAGEPIRVTCKSGDPGNSTY